MKKIVWTFGLIAGGILAGMMFLTMPFIDQLADKAVVIGYASMVLAFLTVYFGIRAYRDNVMAGAIGFGRAFKVGILIALIGSLCYVAAWEVIYYTMAPDFMEKYSARAVEKARAAGASEAALAAKKEEMAKMTELYKNPAINVGATFVEVFWVGLVMVLISAAVLRKDPAGGKAMAG